MYKSENKKENYNFPFSRRKTLPHTGIVTIRPECRDIYTNKPLSFEHGMLTLQVGGNRYVLTPGEGLTVYPFKGLLVPTTRGHIAHFLEIVKSAGTEEMKKFTAAHIRATKRQRAE